jgi:hypothetical protein
MSTLHVPEDAHASTWDNETREANVEGAWADFCTEAAGILGHSLDGDDDADGYSLGTAYDHFLRGETGTEYGMSVQVSALQCAK